jgi:Fe-Mn family superoxide dismutase
MREQGQLPFAASELSFRLEQLQPSIDETLAECHYEYHCRIVTSLNKAVSHQNNLYYEILYRQGRHRMEAGAMDWLVASLRTNSVFLSDAEREIVSKYGAAHFNHTIYWGMLKPRGGGPPDRVFSQAMQKDFGSLEKLKEALVAASAKLDGEGWVWLVWKGGRLCVLVLPGEETPLSAGYEVLMGVDLWKHAYASQYVDARPSYVRAVLSLVDWCWVGKRFSEISK